MKKLFLFLAIGSMFFISCRNNTLNKKVVIPSNSEIKFEPIDEEGYLIVQGDTSDDGLADIEIKIPFQSLMSRICFLRLAYPDKDIIIGPGSISYENSEWIMDAGGAGIRQ